MERKHTRERSTSRLLPFFGRPMALRELGQGRSPKLWLLPLDTRWTLPPRGQELLYSLTHKSDGNFRTVRKFGHISHDGEGDPSSPLRGIKRDKISVVHEGEDSDLKVSVSPNQQLMVGNPCWHERTFQAVQCGQVLRWPTCEERVDQIVNIAWALKQNRVIPVFVSIVGLHLAVRHFTPP